MGLDTIFNMQKYFEILKQNSYLPPKIQEFYTMGIVRNMHLQLLNFLQLCIQFETFIAIPKIQIHTSDK